MSRFSGKEIILFILCVAIVVGIIFFGPFVIMNYWNWFMVPATGFPQISYWLAFGLNMFVGLLRAGQTASNTKKIDNIEDGFGTLIGYALGYLIFWGLGAWIHCGI